MMIFLLQEFQVSSVPVDVDYLTVYQRHNVGAAGTVFVAISSTSDSDGQVGGRVGIGSTQPDARFQVGIGETSFIVDEPWFGWYRYNTTSTKNFN